MRHEKRETLIGSSAMKKPGDSEQTKLNSNPESAGVSVKESDPKEFACVSVEVERFV